MTTANSLLGIIKTEMSPVGYLRSLGQEPFAWQREALNPRIRRMLLMCARQAGKSTTVAGKALWKAKNYPYSLILIFSPTERQSKEVMKKIEILMALDETVKLRNDNAYEKQLENYSRIIALPGSEKSTRGYSGPTMIIIDEAAYVLDETYRAVRPMMTDADTELIMMTTPWGKRGFFFEAWESNRRWKKIMVRTPADIRGGRLVPPVLSEEEFREEMARRGISGYYSPRHKWEWIAEEFEEHGELSFRQEYLLEFIDPAGTLFPHTYVEASIKDIPTLFGESHAKDFRMLEV
jgi:hypothetical protein